MSEQLSFSGADLVFMLAIGLATSLVAWVVSKSIAEVPPEDRQYKDPPPLGFKLVWWLVQWLASLLAPVLRERTHAALMMRLRKAGLDYCLSPAQFIAGRLICALFLTGLTWCIVGCFDRPKVTETGFSARVYWYALGTAALFGYFYPVIWLRDKLAVRKKELMKQFPFFLDIITLCVEAGLNLQGAMNQAVAKGPRGVMRDEFQKVLRDIRAGKSRAESLRAMAERVGESAVNNFTRIVIQAESMGMNLGPVLRTQADQRRVERFLQAEKLAMEAPVKMLFPLIAFIFPCTFVVLAFPIAMKFMHSGI